MKFLSYTIFVSTYFRISLFALVGILSVTNCFGQTVKTSNGRRMMMFGQSSGLTNDTLYLDIDQDIAVQLLPFDELMKIAVAYSPLIKYQTEVANSLNSTYEIAKNQIWQNISGFANYSGGDQSIVSTSRGGQDAIGQFANGYRAGVDLRITLFDLFGRKHQIRQAYSNYRAAILQKESVELQLKRELITVYQDMITAQQVLKVRLIDEQASLAAFRIAEVESQKGKITAEQLANATGSYAQSKSIGEQVKGDFLKNVHYFEALMGVPLQRLKRN